MANNIINVSADKLPKINLTAVETPRYVRHYRANSHKVREFFPAIEARVREHKASSDGAAMATLVAAHSSYLTEEALELARFAAQQSETQAELQKIDSGIAAELDLFSASKKVFAVLFTLAAAASAAGAAISAGVDQKRPTAALAAAAAILLVALGKWIDSVLKKSERGVKKHREIITRMIVSGKFTIDDLTEIYLLVREMKAEAESISKMVDDGEEVAMKVAALNMSYQKLQRKAIRAGRDASSLREAGLEIILKNLE